LLSNYVGAAAGWSLQLYQGKLYFNCTGDGAELQGVTSLAASTWHHIAVARASGTLRLFVNGNLDAAVNDSQNCTSTAALNVGSLGTLNVSQMNGYLDEVRITKALARYTGSFTPPTQEFPHTGPDANATGHNTGDLASITNAAGQVTQFNRYDPAGRVRQMTDPKGVVTDITYTPRGWTSSVTTTAPSIAPFTTGYVYDDAGQLKQVNLPDGTSLGYDHDAAHRLVGITDTRGNSVTYILDNVGNRTGEEVRDPSGTLQRSISRSFDALNRLQQVTGAPM